MGEHVNAPSRRAFVFSSAILGTAVATGLFNVDLTKAYAVTAAEKQAEADAVREQLVSLQADLEAAADRYYAALDERDAAHASMEAEQAKIEEATARIEEIEGRLSERVRSMYRTGPSGFVDFVLGATSFEEFTTNWGLLDTLNDEDQRLVEETKDLRAQLEESKAEFERQERIAEEKAAEAELVAAEAQTRVNEATALMNQLDEEARVLLEEEQARAAAEAAAAAAAAAAAEAEAREAAEAAKTVAESAGVTVTNNINEDGTFDTTSTGDGVVGDYSAVVGFALSRKGCPYVWGAGGPDTFDCSGLVYWSYMQVGVSVPHQSEALYRAAARRVPVSEARPGDVLYRPGHVGIAVGYGGVPYVHAPTFGAVVRDTDPLSWSGFTYALQFA